VLLADRHLVLTMLPRMAVVLLVVLASLVLERLLRLFDFVTRHGAEVRPVLEMIVNLLPHYVGLAMPMAFCLGTITALGLLARNSEIDALEGAGWSLRRIGLPFIGCAAVLALVSIGLFGYVQPFARYAYYKERDAVLAAGWRGRLEAQVFFDIGDDMAISAADVGEDGRTLDEVILLQETPDGPIATTAKRGLILPDAPGGGLRLVLRDARSLMPDGSTATIGRVRIDQDLYAGDGGLRARGESARELTLGELWAGVRASGGAEPETAAEFHDRLIRSFSLLGVAFLSVPLGVAGKRAPLWPRIAIAVVALALYDNIVKFVGGLAALGEAPAGAGLWALALAFNGATLALYLATPGQGGLGPLNRVLNWFGRWRLPFAATPARAGGRRA